jgi:hypothetical protein
VPIVLKSGSLNLLEPSGPVKACNGIALPLPCILDVAEMTNPLGRPRRRWEDNIKMHVQEVGGVMGTG